MRIRSFVFLVPAAALSLLQPNDFAQSDPANNDPVRVSITINADGSRTAYQFDQPHHKATATTTTPDGQVLGRIDYQIDDAGHFTSGLVFGPEEKFLFKSTYKYNPAGRLQEELHLAKDDAIINKIIYNYDAANRPNGYVIFDAAGKVVGRSAPNPTPPSSGKRKSRR